MGAGGGMAPQPAPNVLESTATLFPTPLHPSAPPPQVLGSDYQAALLHLIPPENLLQQFGGQSAGAAVDGVGPWQHWKPAPPPCAHGTAAPQGAVEDGTASDDAGSSVAAGGRGEEASFRMRGEEQALLAHGVEALISSAGVDSADALPAPCLSVPLRGTYSLDEPAPPTPRLAAAARGGHEHSAKSTPRAADGAAPLLPPSGAPFSAPAPSSSSQTPYQKAAQVYSTRLQQMAAGLAPMLLPAASPAAALPPAHSHPQVLERQGSGTFSDTCSFETAHSHHALSTRSSLQLSGAHARGQGQGQGQDEYLDAVEVLSNYASSVYSNAATAFEGPMSPNSGAATPIHPFSQSHTASSGGSLAPVHRSNSMTNGTTTAAPGPLSRAGFVNRARLPAGARAHGGRGSWGVLEEGEEGEADDGGGSGGVVASCCSCFGGALPRWWRRRVKAAQLGTQLQTMLSDRERRYAHLHVSGGDRGRRRGWWGVGACTCLVRVLPGKPYEAACLFVRQS